MDITKENEIGQVEIVDLEEYARRGECPPKGRRYRIKIDGERYIVDDPAITGRQVLILAGLEPPENYTLRVTVAGQRPEKVGLDESVDLTRRGVERFKSMPRDQTEG